MAETAMMLGVSERQSLRIKARIRKEGVRGTKFNSQPVRRTFPGSGTG